MCQIRTPTYHTFPETVTYPQVNGVTLQTTTYYDPRWGVPDLVYGFNNEVTDYDYDGLGRVTDVADPLNTITHYDYTDGPTGQVLQTSLAYGQPEAYTTHSRANGLGQVTWTQRPGQAGATITTDYQYGPLGRLEVVSAPYTDTAAAWTGYAYDALGRTTAITHTDRTTRTFEYGNWDQVTVTDENKHQARYTRDGLGRVTMVEVFTGTAPATTLYARTTYAYDPQDNLRVVRQYDNGFTEIAPPVVITTNSLSQKMAMSDPDMGAWSYTYDANGVLETQTDALGRVITYSYDALGRPSGKSYSDGSPPVSYSYDQGANGKGRRVGMMDGSGATSWDYDPAGRVLTETRTILGAGTFHTGYGYDRLGRVQTMTYPDGEVVTYTYNGQGLVDGLTTSLSETTYLVAAGYNALDQPAFLNLGNGLTTRYGYYDPDYDPDRASFCLRSIQTTGPAGDLQDLSYAYDPAGNLSDIWDLANQVTWSYEYDPLDRLSRAERSVGGLPEVYGYGYDPLNNLVAKSDPNADLNLTYPDPSQSHPHAPLQAWDGPSLLAEFTYNANGNRATKLESTGSITYTYDIENRLTQVVSDTGSSLLSTSFVYDGDGRRVKRSTSEGENHYYVNDAYETGDPTYTYVIISHTGYEIRPSATYADGLHAAWEEEFLNYHLYYAHQISDTWSTPSLIDTPGLYAQDPALAVYNGVLHVAWIGNSSTYGTRHLYYSRSTDGGLTWSAPLTLSVESTSTGYDSSQPALALDAAGTLHLVWAEEADIGNCTDCDHIYYRTSTDAGQSWSGATRLNNWTPTDFDRSVQPDVAVADNGDVAAVWRRAPGDSGPGDIYLRRRVGGTWQSPQMISEGDGQARWPRIAVGEDGSLHIAWHYDAGSHDEIHYRSWDGSAWDTIVSISGEVRAVNHSGATDDPDHDIAVNRAGQVFVAWITEIYDTALATRSGTSWSPPQILVEHLGSIHLSLATDEMGAPQVIQSKADIGTTVYHITSGASSDITKHYYANGQRIATQVDGVLYYVLGDAGGQSALFADSTGQEVGHIWYDPLGGVIQNTLPATLTEKLAGHLDTATGLQYHGARYYDPSVGSFLQPDPFGGVPQAPQSLNRFAFSVDDLAPISTSPGRTSYPRATATAVNLGFLAEARWWVQQGVSQGITYGTTQRLAEYSLIRLSVSASRHRLLTRLPERAIEVLGGRSVVETLPANRSLHTLSTGGIKVLRGQALERSAFDEFTENAGRWTGRVGDDYLSHSLSWMGSRWFGASLAGAGDLAIQWLWPGTGDAWNRDNYGLTPEQFIGRGAVAAGGGLLAWGTVELTTATLVAGGVIAAPAEMPFIAGALIFVGVEFVYEWQIKPHLYEWLDLKGINEP